MPSPWTYSNNSRLPTSTENSTSSNASWGPSPLSGMPGKPASYQLTSPGVNLKREKKQIRFVQDDLETNQKFIETMEKIIKEYLIEKLPKGQFSEEEMLANSNPKDREFLKCLFKSSFFVNGINE